DVLQVECKDDNGNIFTIVFHENQFAVSCRAKEQNLNWVLELKVAEGKELPFQSIEHNRISAEFRNFNYGITCAEGTVEKGGQAAGYVFRLIPSDNRLVVDCTNQR